jgi:energy-coupling factor transport system permease protein
MIPGLAASRELVRQTWLDRLDAATVLGMVLLGIISSLFVSGAWLAGMILGLMMALIWTGLNPATLWRAMRPWVFVAVLVLAVHVFTTTAAAPLGHPSWGGLMAGVWALARIGLALGWLALFARLKSLDDLVRAVRWWLRPFEKVGLQTGQLALVLAVALGTVPQVMSEGRRVDAVLRMRRATPAGGKATRWRRFLDRVLVVVPLMEGLLRRAEVLSLSLRTRQPATAMTLVGPPLWQLAVLVLWLGLIIRLLWPGETT